VTLAALRVRGPFDRSTGYDHHVRKFVRELVNQGVAVELVDIPQWGPARLPPHLRDPSFNSFDTPTSARVTLHFCTPHQVTPDRGRATHQLIAILAEVETKKNRRLFRPFFRVRSRS
jgi:hypothetical protein